KIFERFYQNDLPANMVVEGSGIGLAISREFVKLYNGSISVTSDLNRGSSFLVSLPLKPLSDPASIFEQATTELQEAGTVPEINTSKEPVKHKKTTLLLVEDNEDFRFYLKDNLQVYFNIVEASNGR